MASGRFNGDLIGRKGKVAEDLSGIACTTDSGFPRTWGFISQAMVQNQRSAAKPDCDAEKRQSQRHAEHGGEARDAASARAEHGEVRHIRPRCHFDDEGRQDKGDKG